ncbi:outer membrane channel protein TolC [Morganella psychrotolerans]|uniref:Outer membrane protein TolC n=1 Tax=Morganella psychrotolerans TaxID=368603 RepID=A0A5M9R1F9_9GAMM|nr:outer membrane channel protein TolC [Morganella psychrotolerans]KAA8713972.1 outer membrane channel protein TolC [Morganella psychrotolerans]OBU03282.1 outer membrane channel protein TolC [Morganella psychrotolerans]
MKKLLSLLIAVSVAGFSTVTQAEDLLQVYQKAKETNPTLRQTQAERNQAFEKINEARSPLLPQLGLGGGYEYGSGYRDNRNQNSNTLNAQLKLTQTIFDMSKWRQLDLQEKTAGISDITFQSAQQQLIVDTSVAYFNVLRALDTLSYVQSQKEAVYRQLDQTTQRFNVGLVAITDVQNARANYDSVLAQEVSGRNDVENTIEQLRQVSGIYYSDLASLDVNRFKTSSPDAIEVLLKEAQERNLNLLSASLGRDLAKEQISMAQSGHYPTVELSAGTGVTNNDYSGSGYPNNYANNYAGQSTIGVNVSIPLYTGGMVSSQVDQAQYGYTAASEKLEAMLRQVVQVTRSSYNNINASISSVNAYKQVVTSAESSLNATEAGYQVGTRTIVDVLNATTTLYEAKKSLSNARYDYLISQLYIGQARGTLNEDDVLRLNQVLGKSIPTAPSSVTGKTAN